METTGRLKWMWHCLRAAFTRTPTVLIRGFAPYGMLVGFHGDLSSYARNLTNACYGMAIILKEATAKREAEAKTEEKILTGSSLN